MLMVFSDVIVLGNDRSVFSFAFENIQDFPEKGIDDIFFAPSFGVRAHFFQSESLILPHVLGGGVDLGPILRAIDSKVQSVLFAFEEEIRPFLLDNESLVVLFVLVHDYNLVFLRLLVNVHHPTCFNGFDAVVWLFELPICVHILPFA